MTDAVIIGGGHNGLVCAAYLAKAGRKVVVCEARARPGGAAATDLDTPEDWDAWRAGRGGASDAN